jgi:predicted transcriptional regulator
MEISTPKEPSRLEMQVLALLWERGPATVREVQEALPDGKTRAYTTVLTVLQVMEKKGLLTHVSQGNTHVYQPTTTRRQTLGPVLKNLVRQLFGGSPATAMQHLLAESEVSPEELAKLKQLIAEQEAKSATPRAKGKKS